MPFPGRTTNNAIRFMNRIALRVVLFGALTLGLWLAAAQVQAFTIHNDTPYVVSGMLCSPLWGTSIFSFNLEPDQTTHWQRPHTGDEFEVRANLYRNQTAEPEKATLPLNTPDCRVEAVVVRGVFQLVRDH